MWRLCCFVVAWELKYSWWHGQERKCSHCLLSHPRRCDSDDSKQSRNNSNWDEFTKDCYHGDDLWRLSLDENVKQSWCLLSLLVYHFVCDLPCRPKKFHGSMRAPPAPSVETATTANPSTNKVNILYMYLPSAWAWDYIPILCHISLCVCVSVTLRNTHFAIHVMRNWPPAILQLGSNVRTRPPVCSSNK